MQNQGYKKSKRKFHDSWAFFLFIALTLAANFIYYSSTPREKLFSMPPTNILISSVVYFLSYIALATLGLIFIPEFLMHFGCIACPLIAIAFSIYLQDYVAMGVSILFGCLSLAYYFIKLRHDIKYSAKVVHASSSLLVRNFLVMIPLIFFSVSCIILQLFFSLVHLDKQYENNYFIYSLCLLQLYWTFFLVFYLVRVYISTVIALELLNVTDTNIVKESLKNVCYAIGSICFGSLLIAVVATLRSLASKANEDERNVAMQILLFIVQLLLAILESIIQFINEWAFVYIAIYGTSYVQGIKQSYDKIMKQNNSILVNNLCLLPILNLMSLAVVIGLYPLILTFKYKFESVQQVISFAFIAYSGFLTVDIFLSSFDSACKAFLFVHDEEPFSIKNKFPKVYDALENQKTKNR